MQQGTGEGGRKADARAPQGGGGGLGAWASAEGEPPRPPLPHGGTHRGAPASTGTKLRGAPRTHNRQGGGESKEAGATTHSKGTGGQGAAHNAVDPGVPDTGEGTERERARAARASPSARGTCDVQRVTQPLPPVACSLGGPGLALGHSGSNQPTLPPSLPPSLPPNPPTYVPMDSVMIRVPADVLH